MVELKLAHKLAAVSVLLVICVAGYFLFSGTSAPPTPHQQTREELASSLPSTATTKTSTTNNDNSDKPSSSQPMQPSEQHTAPAASSVETHDPTQPNSPSPPPPPTIATDPQPSSASSAIQVDKPDQQAKLPEQANQPSPPNVEMVPLVSPNSVEVPAVNTNNKDEPMDAFETKQPAPSVVTNSPTPSAHDEHASEQSTSDAELARWTEFKSQYRRQYPSLEEETRRQSIFIGNLRYIRTFNEHSRALYKLDINQFADFTRDEINNQFIGPTLNWNQTIGAHATAAPIRILSDQTNLVANEQGSPAPGRAIDWRNLTTSEPVGQGTCRDSAVFAVVASLESALNAMYQQTSSNVNEISNSNQVEPAQQPSGIPKIKLSEQQLLDCLGAMVAPQPGRPPVCSGHLSMIEVFDYLEKEALKLATQVEYREFKQLQMRGQLAPGTCRLPDGPGNEPSKAKLSAYIQVHRDNMQEALLNSSPLVLTIDASQPTFHFYKSGLYHELACSSDHYNLHALLVGYSPAGQATGTTEPFYTIRASLGTNWGESGHMRLLMDESRNKCLPQHLAAYPNIALA